MYKQPRRKLLDETIKELRDRSNSRQVTQRIRAKKINGIRYHGIDEEGDIKFTSNSQDGSKTYTQYVRFHDLKDMTEFGRDDVLNMLRNSDVGVSCNDPSFLYWGGAYNATKGGWNIAREDRGLNDPNKALKQEFTLCKHLIAVLTALPFYWNTMIKDLVKWNETYNKNNDLPRKPSSGIEEEVVEEVTTNTTVKEEEEVDEQTN